MTSLIDADSIIHIIAYNYRITTPEEKGAIEEVQAAVDSFVKMILDMTNATYYVGAIGNETQRCFRHSIYKYAKYKGNRPPSHEWVLNWKSTIRGQMKKKWGFVDTVALEADDIIASMVDYCNYFKQPCIICSPDKDLKQIAGTHFDYKKQEDVWKIVSPVDAWYNFCMQLLTGDTSDNIKAVPGLGVVKATALLKDIEPVQYLSAIKNAYCKYFGEYYGPIIYQETYDCIKLRVINIPTNVKLNFLMKR
jgi:5'-3' exonuclease